jgi:hypothetical protein
VKDAVHGATAQARQAVNENTGVGSTWPREETGALPRDGDGPVGAVHDGKHPLRDSLQQGYHSVVDRISNLIPRWGADKDAAQAGVDNTQSANPDLDQGLGRVGVPAEEATPLHHAHTAPGSNRIDENGQATAPGSIGAGQPLYHRHHHHEAQPNYGGQPVRTNRRPDDSRRAYDPRQYRQHQHGEEVDQRSHEPQSEHWRQQQHVHTTPQYQQQYVPHQYDQ